MDGKQDEQCQGDGQGEWGRKRKGGGQKCSDGRVAGPSRSLANWRRSAGYLSLSGPQVRKEPHSLPVPKRVGLRLPF